MCQKDLDAYLEAVLGLVHLKHQCILNGSFSAGLANGGCKMPFLLAMGFRFLKVGGSCEVKIKFSLFFFSSAFAHQKHLMKMLIWEHIHFVMASCHTMVSENLLL